MWLKLRLVNLFTGLTFYFRQYITPRKDCLACHCATIDTMLSNLSVMLSQPILVCFAPVTLSRPNRSPYNGTFTSDKILSFLHGMSAGDASCVRGGSLEGMKTSKRKFSRYSKYWQTSECLFWLNRTTGKLIMKDFLAIFSEYLVVRRNEINVWRVIKVVFCR